MVGTTYDSNMNAHTRNGLLSMEAQQEIIAIAMEGMKRTADISTTEVLPTWSRKKFTIFIVTTALLAAGLLIFELLQR